MWACGLVGNSLVFIWRSLPQAFACVSPTHVLTLTRVWLLWDCLCLPDIPVLKCWSSIEWCWEAGPSEGACSVQQFSVNQEVPASWSWTLNFRNCRKWTPTVCKRQVPAPFIVICYSNCSAFFFFYFLSAWYKLELGRGTPTEKKMPPSEWPVGKLPWCRIDMGGPSPQWVELSLSRWSLEVWERELNVSLRSKPVSSILPGPCLFPASRFLPWLQHWLPLVLASNLQAKLTLFFPSCFWPFGFSQSKRSHSKTVAKHSKNDDSQLSDFKV